MEIRKCPSCGTEAGHKLNLNHNGYEFNVQCSCGMQGQKFNAYHFMNNGEHTYVHAQTVAGVEAIKAWNAIGASVNDGILKDNDISKLKSELRILKRDVATVISAAEQVVIKFKIANRVELHEALEQLIVVHEQSDLFGDEEIEKLKTKKKSYTEIVWYKEVMLVISTIAVEVLTPEANVSMEDWVGEDFKILVKRELPYADILDLLHQMDEKLVEYLKPNQESDKTFIELIGEKLYNDWKQVIIKGEDLLYNHES